MKEYFVFYNDDYYDNGGVGLESFESQKEAEKFIENRWLRIRNDKNHPMEKYYTVIYGSEQGLEPIEVVSKIRIV